MGNPAVHWFTWMAKAMTEKDLHTTLAALEELHKKATPPPWKLDEHYQSYIWGPNSAMVADDGQDEEGTLTRMRGVGANLPLKVNGELIAALRNAFPNLSQWIRKLVAERDAALFANTPPPFIEARYDEMMAVQGEIVAILEQRGIDPCPAIKLSQDATNKAWGIWSRYAYEFERLDKRLAAQAAEIVELRKAL